MLDFSDDSYSFQIQPVNQRKKNIKLLVKLMKHNKIAKLNQSIITLDRNFDQLYENYKNITTQTEEVIEVQQILSAVYNKGHISRQIPIERKLKFNQKVNQDKLRQDESIQESEDDEVEINQKIKNEIKQKLLYLIINQVPLPFILNFIEFQKQKEQFIKLKIKCENSLLDSLNFTLIKDHKNEEELNQNLKCIQIIKMKELLMMSLEQLEKSKENIITELNEMFLDLKSCKTQLMKNLELFQYYDDSLDPQINKLLRIINNLILYCKTKSSMNGQFNKSILMPRKNGLRWLQKIIMLNCWVSQISFPEILIYIQMKGDLDKNKSNPKRQCVIQLSKKLDFLRKIYNIPEVRKKCWEQKVVLMDQSKKTPSYILQEYNLHLHQLHKNLFYDKLYMDNMQDYVLESQLRMLVQRFQQQKYQIFEAYQDLRCQINMIPINILYKDYLEWYKYDIEQLSRLDYIKHAKDVIIVCLIKHLGMLLKKENIIKTEQEIIRFNFDNRFSYSIYNKDKDQRDMYQCNKYFYIKILLCDFIAMDQPFPYLFKYLTLRLEKIESNNQEDILAQLLSEKNIRNYLLTKYNLKIGLEQTGNRIIITNIPQSFDDITRELYYIPWEYVISSQLQIIYRYRNYLKNEISQMITSKEFQDYRSNLKVDTKLYQQQSEIIIKLENFQKDIQK
ncbi:unnamed protein product [Paramecium pentaurelia]|uniref:Uncharacterized protein n=1 Tax=Paramecium pentaurelia TaxID=43138 RepID=A0A8S1USY5_9CILI|nr:unnamed protein product [Paramecium pentaurelia]